MEDKFYKIKNKFPIFNHEENKNLIYFDNASTTQKPYQVIESITNFYSTINANVHRGAYPLSEKSTQLYEAVREKVSKFIGSNSENSIVFTKSATEAINIVAYAWALKNLKEQDEILLTEIEHHSNLVPWQFVSKKTGCKLKFIQIDSEGHIDWSQLDLLINSNTKLVSVTHQSNVFGSISPINEITEKAKKTVYECDLKGPVGLIFGSEDKGISSGLLKIIDKTAKLPMSENIESLNVSVACGVTFYELIRQRLIS